MTRRLLYVDDDPDIRAIVQLALELDGEFVPVLAPSGAEALLKPSNALADGRFGYPELLRGGCEASSASGFYECGNTLRSIAFTPLRGIDKVAEF